MPTPTPPLPATAKTARKIRMPSGKEIYDALMKKIEPELLSDNLPLLEKKFGKEPSKEHVERLKRYRAAFVAYDKALKAWAANLRLRLSQVRRRALRAAEGKLRTGEEDATLKSLEAQMGTV